MQLQCLQRCAAYGQSARPCMAALPTGGSPQRIKEVPVLLLVLDTTCCVTLKEC